MVGLAIVDMLEYVLTTVMGFGVVLKGVDGVVGLFDVVLTSGIIGVTGSGKPGPQVTQVDDASVLFEEPCGFLVDRLFGDRRGRVCFVAGFLCKSVDGDSTDKDKAADRFVDSSPSSTAASSTHLVNWFR